MDHKPFLLYNTLTRTKETFEPLHAPHVGLYVCGPTVYGEPHLGHARPAITFDVLYRLLTNLGYKVRYVRNITDVGHLEHDADEGEDKIAKKARLEHLEPMEVAHFYAESYRSAMRMLGVLSPSIEPLASGHIIEQIALIQKILDGGYAYEVNGSVYFDVTRYDKDHHYGILSGRDIDNLYANTRQLDGQSEKRHPLDFALWKRAEASHIMRWPSPWGEGFPGWHLECSAMSTRYLGETFDIHGGGLDLMFPHHECEIAQSVAAQGHPAVRYWVHNNLITIGGQKMGKSLGNFITLTQLFAGTHPVLPRAYTPMAVRFFVLQAHYRSTLDFSNEGLQAATKGLDRMLDALKTLPKLTPGTKSSFSVNELSTRCWDALLDDMNTPVALAALFDGAHRIARMRQGEDSLTAEDLAELQELYQTVLLDVMGLAPQEAHGDDNRALETAMRIALEYRALAKSQKDYATSDRLRDEFRNAGIEVKDGPDGATWNRISE